MMAASELPPLIFVHVHYPDIWEEMARDIASAVNVPFGLVLTHCGQSTLAKPDTPYLVDYREIVVQNRGRDVLPFLTALRGDLPPYDIGLKLHTKRSPHRDDGAEWRRFLTRSLLSRGGNGPGPMALQTLRTEPHLGLIAPEGHLLPLQGRLALNEKPMAAMLSALGIFMRTSELHEGRFAASTMFWFRAEALSPFSAAELDPLFENEAAQLDGTAAHAAERLFVKVCESQGFAASSMEALPAIICAGDEQRGMNTLDRDTLRNLTDAAISTAANPFSLPMADFWSRHRRLLRLAHLTYRRVPPPLWRAMRRLVRRYASRHA
ncbi:lipopolysaccharide biosynthesis protein [Pseudochelatococcus contaminans]|uniref:Lipopolysaccharide biosynthesis protein n=2 Tax=Pseudochelatococcus contaminans TaxID=1538103 RepID=A0A7W6EG05_9HYPH|nr:lipopolysaccharide biosynthesis protein [Pseudochelatococcus contaminans]